MVWNRPRVLTTCDAVKHAGKSNLGPLQAPACVEIIQSKKVLRKGEAFIQQGRTFSALVAYSVGQHA